MLNFHMVNRFLELNDTTGNSNKAVKISINFLQNVKIPSIFLSIKLLFYWMSNSSIFSEFQNMQAYYTYTKGL